MKKAVVYVAISAAVLSASVFGIVYFLSKADIAKSNAIKAESESAMQLSKEKELRLEKSKAEALERTAIANQKKAEEDTKKADADFKRSQLEHEKAALDKIRAEQEHLKAVADQKRVEAEKAKVSDELSLQKSKESTAKAESEKAKSLAAAEEAKSQEALYRLEHEKLLAEKLLAEKFVYEMRLSDIETLEKELQEYKMELDERERALKPELTLKDLDDSSADVIEDAKNQKLSENDKSLPLESRKLAKSERLSTEKYNAMLSSVRSNVVARIEKLYIEAIQDDRVIDAEFYRNQIKTMYPDWEFSIKKHENKK
jgi:colicin import membrane protein